MKYVVLIIISLFLFGCNGEEVYVDNKANEHIIPKISEVDVYSDVYLYDLFNKRDVEITSENLLIDTTKLGKNIYKLEYIYKDKKYEYNIEYNVVDNEAPRYLGGTNKTVYVNHNGDLCNLIMYGDNYDGDLKCEIIGNYDLSKIGTYKLIYKLSDSSNNTTDINVTLNVINKSNSTSGGSTATNKINFSDILEKHKNENTEVGIDISKWQGNIDFEKVKNAGASFVMMRIGVQTTAQGELTIDPYYEQNINNAKAAGLKVGVYLYSIATNSKESIEHANWVLDVLDGTKLDLPIVFDWENWSKWNSYKISFYEINDIANKFMSTVEAAGYEGMLYSSKYYLENIWTNKFEYPIWLAHYTSKTNYEGDYMMWQLCNTGRIDGINGDVDINVMYK